jgi:hypothetical protein
MNKHAAATLSPSACYQLNSPHPTFAGERIARLVRLTTCSHTFSWFLFFSIIWLTFGPQPMFGQVPTGIPPFGTFNHDAIDTINVGNLNIHFQFPVFAKKGRGLDFRADFMHDNSMYQQIEVGNTINYYWSVTPWATGWSLAAPLTDVLQYNTNVQLTCNYGGQLHNLGVYSNFVYIDSNHTPHVFNNAAIGYPSQCYTPQTVTAYPSPDGYRLTISCDHSALCWILQHL